MTAKDVFEARADVNLEALDTRTTCTPILRTPSLVSEGGRRLL